MNTTFVIGAGASCEFGLPSGSALKSLIANALDIKFRRGYELESGEYLIVEGLKALAKTTGERDINAYLHAAWHVRDSMPAAPSIDNFLNSHQGNSHIEICGKLAIASLILQAERDSRLYKDDRSNGPLLSLGSAKDTWLIDFFGRLTEDCDVRALESRLSRVTLIIFNYDRCVEYFLLNALQIYYSIDQNEAAALLGHLEIFHPYGTVGSLPMTQLTHASIPFGATLQGSRLLQVAQGLRTFTEGVNQEESDIRSIRNAILTANRIIFLGFAFHPLNLDLLNPGDTKSAATTILGSSYGLSGPDAADCTAEVRRVLANFAVGELETGATCAELYRNRSRALSFRL